MTDLLRDKDTRKADAEEVAGKMYGDNWERILNRVRDLDPIFAEFLEEVPYGTVYPRTGLKLEYREICAISVLTQLNLKPQLRSHIIAARNIGISRTEILELFLHLSMFIGFPLVLDALEIAKMVFEREDEKSRLS
ncbi:MAG: carboxymuconolactone decarboxylase family protein [Candidatus Kariarchaeaceae archaeon]|jgi:4-carboxymuconolactone decarboxylase